jgi:probable rRNA maturation factor
VSIEIANESGLPVDEAGLAALARYVLDELGVHPLAELSVLLVDTATMADLHQRWLGEQGPTDVLAFPMDELRPPGPGGERMDRDSGHPGPAPALLGDVVLCPEVARHQAAGAGQPEAEELQMLCTHGILHLLGFDHAEPAGQAEMFSLQDRLLGSWRDRSGRGARNGSGGEAGGSSGGEAGGSSGRGAPGGHGQGAGGGSGWGAGRSRRSPVAGKQDQSG